MPERLCECRISFAIRKLIVEYAEQSSRTDRRPVDAGRLVPFGVIVKRTRLVFLVAAVVVLLLLTGMLRRSAQSKRMATSAPIAASKKSVEETNASGTLSAAAATSISGKVTARDGGPIEGAHVCATDTVSQVEWQPIVNCADTSRAGTYSIALPGGGAYSVTAEAQGFVPVASGSGEFGPTPLTGSGSGDDESIVLVPAGGSMSHDLVLERGGVRLAGVVLDATGGVIAGASLRAMRSAPPFTAVRARSGQEGRFAFWVRPGPVTLLADASGYAPVRVYRVAPAGDAVIRMVPASLVSGVVVAAEDGHSLPDAQVRAMPVGARFPPVEPVTRSSADGTFTLKNLEPGAYVFVVEGNGRRGTSGEPLAIGLAERRENVRIAASAVAQVSGRVVVDPAATPCAQGIVTLGPMSAGRSGPFDPPDAAPASRTSLVPSLVAGIESDGVVRFPAAPPGIYRVSVQCAGYLLRDGPLEVEVRASDVRDLVWKVAAGPRLTIRFVGEDGRPVPAARARLSPPARAGKGTTIPILADGNGRYEHAMPLYPGVYTIRPEHGYDAEPLDVEVKDGPVEAVLHLRGKGSILVTVRSARGEPIDDIRVYAVALSDTGAQAPHARSESPAPVGPPELDRRVEAAPLGDGHFRVGPLVPGRFEVHASDGTNAPFPAGSGPSTHAPHGEVVEVRSGGDVEVTIAVDRGASIQGRVVDTSRQPVPDVWVRARCEPAYPGGTPSLAPDTPARRFVSGADGRFAIDGLSPAAVCSIEAERPLGAMGVVAGAHPGEDVVVSLPDPGKLSGSSEGPSGQPVESFELLVQNGSTGRTLERPVVAAGGRWIVAGVPPGALHLQARSSAGDFASADVQVGSGQSVESVRLVFGSSRGGGQTPSPSP
jgi:hypothetical protein